MLSIRHCVLIFTDFRQFKKVIEMSLLTISITFQGKTKEVTKKQEKVEVEEIEQKGPRGGKRGEMDGEEGDLEDGGGEDKDREKEGEEQGEEGEGQQVEGTQLQ